MQAVARAAESQPALLGPAAEPGRLCLSALGRDEAESVTSVTLRAVLGPDVLRSRPYRLAGAVDADFAAVDRRLASGAVAAPAGAYAP